jgi:hypothetical protein
MTTPTNDQTHEIEELRAQVAHLSRLVTNLQPAEAAAEAAAPAPTSTRRGMLKLAGAAAVGAAAVAVGSNAMPAAALFNDPMVLGNAPGGNAPAGLTHTSIFPTRFDFLALDNNTIGTGFLFQSGSGFSNKAAAFDAALSGWASTKGAPHGIYGYSNQDGGFGTIGRSDSGVGVFATGTVADLQLGGNGVVPLGTSVAHLHGEVIAAANGSVWVCVASGTPGTWREIAGPSTAGSFHAVTPTRVYDSRAAAPAPGVLSAGSNRTISVADGRDLTTGAVTAANLVPAGATAITANVTVVDTTGAGFLTINPGGNTTVTAATVNWFAAGQILNNGVNITVNATRQVTAIAGGSGGVNFVIDVTGYYL